MFPQAERRRALSGTSLNILKNALRPGYLGTMVHKLMLRGDSLLRREDPVAVRAWCEQRQEDAATYAAALDPSLWAKALGFGDRLEAYGAQKLAELGVSMGGGGHYPLLHFLVRHRRPSVAVETGVAAGFTSAAILAGMDTNGLGRLYSSDFPYVRLNAPERYIGCAVEEPLKARWELRILGDRKNLPEIVKAAGPIDLVHYDSDKSYPGRRWALETLQPCLSPDAVIIMDDIQDNWFFRDYVERRGCRFKIFGFQGKYLGMIER